MKTTSSLILVALSLVCVGLLPKARALSPPPDGGYPGGNTAEGTNALFSSTSGVWNTAIGYAALYKNATGNGNTATGIYALYNNSNGYNNVATGGLALFENTTGLMNTAYGYQALTININGSYNTATGTFALVNNTAGLSNTANGTLAMQFNVIGNFNTAIGAGAFQANRSGNNNTVLGAEAGNYTTGNDNTVLGCGAGKFSTTGNNNIYIGSGVSGVAGESNACYIASIFGQTSASGIPVLIGSDNKLGTVTSSKRFKKDIRPMDKASEAILALRPVTFCYKKEIDPHGTSQFGLVAEDVEKINPDLVVRDKEGKPYSVRYDQVNAMLLNEFLKAHRRMEEQD
jgi:hypothetical protein